MKNFTKKTLYLLTLLALPCTLAAQDYRQNYILSSTMLNSSGSSYIDHVTYYDGLGRASQTLEKGLTPARQNLLSLQEYDAVGRPTNSWLPIVTSANYMDPASFKAVAPTGYSGDTRPFSQSVYEASPLNRIVQQYGPGSAWYSGHPQKTNYLTNTATTPLNCINYYMSGETLTKGSNYTTGLLNVTENTDEDGNISYIFADKQERTVLTRQMKGSESHDTYYVYDDIGNLRFVLQPMYQSISNLDQYAFQYKYDGFKRCIWKKLPGAQYIEYVYDSADRLIFSQDGNQRALSVKKWTYYLYDNLNRLTQQGECVDKVTTSNVTVHIRNFYDDYVGFRTAIGGNTNYPIPRDIARAV